MGRKGLGLEDTKNIYLYISSLNLQAMITYRISVKHCMFSFDPAGCFVDLLLCSYITISWLGRYVRLCKINSDDISDNSGLSCCSFAEIT